MFDLGDVWNITRESVGQIGILENADTVVLTITKPDNTTVSPTIVNPPVRTGLYRWDYTPTVAGRHTARWLLTFADGTTDGSSETLDVRPADPGGIVSLEAAKAHLNITKSDNDAELRSWIAAVTEVVESKVGPCVIRTYSTLIETSGWWLPRRPVISVTTITAVGALGGGTAPVVADFYLDAANGRMLYAGTKSLAGAPWVVAYTAGRAVIPANIIQAALIILKHLWETQRGSDMTRGRMSMGGDDDLVLDPGMMWAVPRRAVELLESHRQSRGIA